MSRWDDQFEQHGVFESLARARTQLDAIEDQIEGVEAHESHARILRVLEHVDAMLRASDPELVSLATLEQLMVAANQIAAYLSQYNGAPNQALLDQANSQADQLLSSAIGLAPRVAGEEVQDLQSAVSSFRRSAGQYLRNVEGEAQAVSARAQTIEQQLGQQETKLEAQDARLDAVVSDFQAQFSQAQEQRRTAFSSALEEGRTQLRQVVEESDATLQLTVAKATTDLDEMLADVETKSSKALSDWKEQAKVQHEVLATASAEKLEELDELLAKAVRTVGAIGSTGMAGGYKIVADAEQKQANRMRLVTVLALLGAIGATIFAVAHGVVNGFHVDTFFAKWAISVPFAALAGYAALESSKHRSQATANRKIELQLASLDTYIVSLPEEKQEEVKMQLADRFFGELPAVSGVGADSTD